MNKVNLQEKFAGIQEHWQPRIVGELNGQEVKLVKFQGEFPWHYHENEDELFLAVQGTFRIEFSGHSVTLKPGEFLIVPKGTKHRPVAEEEVQVILFEPAGTRNTGEEVNQYTYQPKA